jgi:hypothetical protein
MLCYEIYYFINFLTLMTVCHVFTGKLLKNIEKMYLLTGEIDLFKTTYSDKHLNQEA